MRQASPSTLTCEGVLSPYHFGYYQASERNESLLSISERAQGGRFVFKSYCEGSAKRYTPVRYLFCSSSRVENIEVTLESEEGVKDTEGGTVVFPSVPPAAMVSKAHTFHMMMPMRIRMDMVTTAIQSRTGSIPVGMRLRIFPVSVENSMDSYVCVAVGLAAGSAGTDPTRISMRARQFPSPSCPMENPVSESA